MKTKWIGLLTTVLLGGMTTLTSCSDNDNSASDQEEDMTETISMPDSYTEDQLAVKIDGLTYVFDADYSGEGAALVKRAVKRTQNILDPKIRNIILHASNVSQLTTNDLVAIAALIINEGSLVMVEPTPKDEEELINKILDTADDCLNGAIESPLFDNLDYENIEWLYSWAINGVKDLHSNYNIESDDRSLEIIGWRGYQTYKSLNVHENDTYTKSMKLTVVKEDSIIAQEPFTYEEKVEMTDYLFGLQADEGAEWMNTPDYMADTQAARQMAVKAIARRANEAEQYIDHIATAQEYNLQIGGIINFKDGDKTISRYHKVLLNRRVWAAYSFNKNCDYYCINQTVRIYNQDLQCGPSAEGEWWNTENWDKWKEASKKYGSPYTCAYGPYLRQFGLEMYLKDMKPTIEKSIPVNSTAGGETNTTGFSYSLGANLGFSGYFLAGGISANVSWSQSVSRVSPDLQLTASTNTSDGKVSWNYTVNNQPKSSYKFVLKGPGANHSSAPDVATKELELQQAWIWSMPSNAGTVDLVTDWTMTDQWLSYERPPGGFTTSEFYIDESFSNSDLKSQNTTQEKNYTFDRIQRINCPPRVKENWSMTIEGDELTGEQKKKVEDFLLGHLSQYYNKSFVLYSAKHGHQKALVDNKFKLDTQDELGRRVAKLKKASESNKNVADLLKMAGKDAGIPDTGSYKIVWRNTDDNTTGVKYENEELTISMAETE